MGANPFMARTEAELLACGLRRQPEKRRSGALGGGKDQTGNDDDDGHRDGDPRGVSVAHGVVLYTKLKRSVCTRSPGTPRRARACSMASCIELGPQMKYCIRW